MQCGYLIIPIQISVKQSPDRSSRFEKCVFLYPLGSPRNIKMEERTNGLICLSVNLINPELGSFLLTSRLFPPALAVFNRMLKVEPLSPVSAYTAAVCEKWPNTSRLGFIGFL